MNAVEVQQKRGTTYRGYKLKRGQARRKITENQRNSKENRRKNPISSMGLELPDSS